MSNKKAIKILSDKYWDTKTGWQKKVISQDDFNYAKEQGVMFDELLVNHDDILKSCLTTIEDTSKANIINAFISSLSNRKLELRSALGSYACGINLTPHKFLKTSSSSCAICGTYKHDEYSDINVLNFERFKFAGVRHLDPIYIWLDLSLFNKIEIISPTAEDINMMKKILQTLSNIEGNKLSDAEKALKFLKSNKNEREQIISVLGYCGILHIPSEEPFYKYYTPQDERKSSNHSKSDWPYPADLWRPDYGLSEDAIKFWFGNL
ncbi:MAG: hypothetical protein COA44_04715 [Arcobacter sp.]|nr:MAG: hypothetical protein COA44_04715 [Arcobacter sp.]